MLAPVALVLALSAASPPGAAPPPADATAVKATLQAGRYEDALRMVYSDATSDATAPEQAPLAEALLEAAGRYGLARDLRKRRPARTAPTLPSALRVRAGGLAWVGASSLNLRAAASAGSPALRRLPIDAPVAVIAIEGDWARVRLEGAAGQVRLAIVDPLRAGTGSPLPAVAAAAPAVAEGWVGAGFLEPAPLVASALKAGAAAALAAGRNDDAAGLLERAVALDPSDAKALRDLVGAAIDAGRFTAAAQAALALAGPGAPLAPGLEVDQVDLAYGCRGDLATAVLVSPSYAELKAASAPKDACAVHVEPWPPCGVCEDATPAEQRRAAREDSAFESRRALLHRLYPTRPWVHARLLNRSAERPLPASKLYVYDVSNPAATDELAGYEPGYSVKLAELAVPALGPLEALDVWMPVPQYAGRRYGLVAVRPMDDLRKALTRLEQGATELVRGDDLAIDRMPPRRGVETIGNPCSVCD